MVLYNHDYIYVSRLPNELLGLCQNLITPYSRKTETHREILDIPPELWILGGLIEHHIQP